MENDGFLHRYFLENSAKTLHKWFHYFDIYERHLQRFRGKAPTMLEVGVYGGGSLAMWKEYLGIDAKIIGLDINPQCKDHEVEGTEIFIGSQDDPVILEQIVQKYGVLDIVLDDGSHQMQHLRDTFEFLYDRMSPTGVYIAEDLHTCYWSEFGGGLGKEGSFIEIAKQKIDELNASHTRGVLPISEFTKFTDAICCYDSIIVFERRRQGKRQDAMTVPM